MSNPIDTLGLSCPNGGDFYVCQDSKLQFLGCCASDPCADGSGHCPQSDLRYSSFDTDTYENISTQSCVGKGDWYTCSSLETPFMGCCLIDACNNDDGCPSKSMVAAKLSSNTKGAAIFETTTASSKSTSTLTLTSTSTSTTSELSVSSMPTPSTTSSRPVSTPTSTSASASESSPPCLSKGAIAGISTAGAVFFVALVAALLFFGRRKWKERRGVVVKGSDPPSPSAVMSNATNSYLHHDPDRILHAPLPFQSPVNSPTRVLAVANEAPTHDNSRTNSVRSWLSKASRQASVNSASSKTPSRPPRSPAPNNWQGLAISPASPQEDIEQQQQQQQQPFIPHSQTLETVAELEGTAISRPTYELPGDTQSHHPSRYRPYRPSLGRVQDFGGYSRTESETT